MTTELSVSCSSLTGSTSTRAIATARCEPLTLAPPFASLATCGSTLTTVVVVALCCSRFLAATQLQRLVQWTFLSDLSNFFSLFFLLLLLSPVRAKRVCPYAQNAAALHLAPLLSRCCCSAELLLSLSLSLSLSHTHTLEFTLPLAPH